MISVSAGYLQTLQKRYPKLKNIPSCTLTFAAFEKDFEIADRYNNSLKTAFEKKAGLINLVYIGRGGYDMQDAVRLLFSAFKNGLQTNDEFSKFRFHFIGTSYAPHGQGKPTIIPVAEELAVSEFVYEQTNRISFYQNIHTLLQTDALIIPGSNDPHYTASKIYPYILAKKSLLAIFNPNSSAAKNYS